MDTFMDKLAQKLTAQEMIKANMAADAEEMSKLKAKTAEYAECLGLMQKLIAEGVQKLEAAKVDGGEINRLVETGIDKVNAVQKDAEAKLNEEVKTILEELREQLARESERLDEVKTSIGAVECVTADLQEVMQEKTEAVNESVHKECVKVYRNVQAAVVEENAKQTESITETVKGLRGKLNAIFGVSIAALVLALGSVVIQVLNLLNFKFF